MAGEFKAGGFEFRGRALPFDEAVCRWIPGGDLYIDARGKRCALSLVGIPSPGATAVAELPGRVWEPDEDQMSLYADTFVEGGLTIRERTFQVLGARIECRRLDAERGVLTVNFRLAVSDEEDGRENEADGVAYCQVVDRYRG